MTTKQCGNCKFWDRKNAENNISCCLYLSYPKCFEEDSRMPMAYEEGNDCPVYVERQDDAVEEDDDQPDENGYTRADEDWFFDDKDD